MKPLEALRLSLLTTAVLWFTGFVTVPFSNHGAREFLVAAGYGDVQNFAWLASQVENFAYTVGRIPLMFAAYLAFRGRCHLPRVASMATYGVMFFGAAVTVLCSGWPQMAGFVFVVSGLLVRLAVAIRRGNHGEI